MTAQEEYGCLRLGTLSPHTLEKCILESVAKSAGQTPDNLQNIAGACSPRGDRVEALRCFDCHTRQPLTSVLLVSSPHWSIPRAIDHFTIKAQSCRNRSRHASHSNHIFCLLAPCPTLAPQHQFPPSKLCSRHCLSQK